ncbi:7012_t:CDS:2 [Paraglomus occultum]|uniref:7012_t:CDS:1 n=1 Tax=Paraglomus occultum TaxID=144539 RepID=A0A9N9BK24_9GLOM|nr:7012_t:CDS:2 [Paraglomus occultum]
MALKGHCENGLQLQQELRINGNDSEASSPDSASSSSLTNLQSISLVWYNMLDDFVDGGENNHSASK